jgi:predicted nucleic acid-binding protein
MKLVDTSAWIEFLRGAGNSTAAGVADLLTREEAAWCEIVALELWNGVTARQRPQLEKLERLVTSYPVNAAVWRCARQVASKARDKGLTVPVSDLIISACARVHGLELQHHGDEHFEMLDTVTL